MANKTPITIAKGDGIGPEIMDAVLFVLEKASAPLEYNEIEIGEKAFLKGHVTGISPEAWNIILKNKAFLKAPITTPQGGGFKSLNVTIRTTLSLFANIRPCRSYFPFVATKHPDMDVVIVRENEEDLYSGIEYRQTPHSSEALKIITRDGSERICRYAFDYAKQNQRKKVTCFTKDNIMKITDGLFRQVYEEISKDYPEILNEHFIVDIGSAKLANTPEIFDVIVLPNLYGDILSDIAAQIAGSIGLVGCANIGNQYAMFEAIHGSAPKRAGKNLANPSALLLSGILMLTHLGFNDTAEIIHNAWLKTLEDGIHTYDIYKEEVSKKKVGTKEFSECIANNLGKKPSILANASYLAPENPSKKPISRISTKRILVGVDIFIYFEGPLRSFFDKISHVNVGVMHLKTISNRGVQVWPEGAKQTYCVDQWKLRFLSDDLRPSHFHEVVGLQQIFERLQMDVIKIVNLYTFDGKPGFS